MRSPRYAAHCHLRFCASSTAPPTSTPRAATKVSATFVTDLREALGGVAPTQRATTHDAGRRGRQPVQGTAGVRRQRCRRLLRPGTARRAAHRPSRPARRAWPVHRRGRPERERQVERREGRAAPCDPSRRTAPVGVVVHDRDDAGAPSVRGARRCAARRCRRSARLAARAARGRARVAARAPPRVAERWLAAVVVDRPVRGAVHTGRPGHGEPVPRHPRECGDRRPESDPRHRHVARGLLRPAAAAPWAR